MISSNAFSTISGVARSVVEIFLQPLNLLLSVGEVNESR